MKAGEVFRDYEFNLKSWRITFRTIFAEVEAGNVKGERRYFILHPDEPVKVDKDQKSCLIHFEYRPFTDEDLKHYRVKTKAGEEKKTGIKQEDLNIILKDKILGQIKEIELKAFLSQKQGSDERSESDEKSFLEAHLYKYTRKITSDFFIHKNLKGFLDRGLDYFIQSEIIDLNNLEPRHITRAKVVEGIGKRIIEFLSQIEEFQKKLWEKKKFVLKTNYVITIDKVPKEFHKEIYANKKQLKEWEELGFEIATPSARNDKKRESLRGAERRSNLKLPVDTKHFDDDFKKRLLERISERGNLDDLINGLLIKSENWQAINLLLQKYRGQVKCIYIDPPYNTGSDEFIYKDKYQHSCWLSMMGDRMAFVGGLMLDDGAIFVSIDDNERVHVEKILALQFGEESLIGPIIVQVNKGGRDYLQIAKTHEYLICSALGDNFEMERARDVSDFGYQDSKGKWNPRELRNRNPKFTRKNRPNLYYPVYVNPNKSDSDGFCAISLEKTSEHSIEVFPRNSKGEDSCWRWSHDKVLVNCDPDDLKNSEVVAKQKSGGGWNIYEKYRGTPQKAKSIWDDTGFRTENGSIRVRHLFGIQVYDFPKPVELIKEIISFSTGPKELILDFFAGSGTTAHAVIELNKEDGGNRKYILIEMADYFDTVIIPRIKKVCYSSNWKNGRPQDTNGVSQIIKYHYLEQYEDTLHNIEFPQAEKGQKALELFGKGNGGNEYLMKYFLQYETEGSLSLLNLKQFENPFEYKLKIISGNKGEEIVKVDLVETFNYLIGLKVGRYKFFKENGKKYTIVLGEKGNRRIAIVWRPTKSIDLEKDKEVIDKTIGDFEPDEVFINGDAFYPKGYKVIETEFKALMGV